MAELGFQKIPMGPDTNQANKTALALRRKVEKIRNGPLQTEPTDETECFRKSIVGFQSAPRFPVT